MASSRLVEEAELTTPADPPSFLPKGGDLETLDTVDVSKNPAPDAIVINPESDHIDTPRGKRLRSSVHQIVPGTVLDGRDFTLINVTKFGEVSNELVTSKSLLEGSGGTLLIPANVTKPPIGPQNLAASGNSDPTRLKIGPGPLSSLGQGLITAVSWTNTSGTPIQSFSTT
ncbi:hypothetical protein G7Y89_g7536 [Cudoniella acicularis]|uniref:Uncharacterized protein n=1 Tax=Cudoniella acicularis TaxID=354080 RepID=A0A8H4RJ49_9HELO|nr:hypothetical protein G7Y89_g7536 [Cudoniella acicularis]